MKKVLASSVVVLMVVFLSAGLGLAGNGKGGGNGGGGNGGGGDCGGTGISLVCSGVAVEIAGMVSDVSYTGSGLVVDGTEVYGIGPYRYWDSLGIDRPEIGDEVTVDGMEVTFTDGSTKIIAMSISFENRNTIELRQECDAVTGVGGWPLWRGGSKNGN